MSEYWSGPGIRVRGLLDRVWPLLALLSAVHCGIPPPDPQSTRTDPTREGRVFIEVSEATGLVFRHSNGFTDRFPLPEIAGSGVTLFDYDNDGDLDVYFIQSGDWPAPGAKSADESQVRQPLLNRLFRNLLVESETLQFEDVTSASGLGDSGYGMGVAVGDIDNDGDLDVYVTNVGSNAMFRNQGDGTFSNITRESGSDDQRWNVSASFLDYDGDQRLDLFVTGYVDFTSSSRDCFHSSGAQDYCSPLAYRPIADRLFKNMGQGRFTGVTIESGINTSFGAGLGVTARDFNSDGWTDIFVANDGTPNQLWMNQGNGSFKDQGLFSGTAYNSMGEAEAGMGVAAADFDQDGDEDLFLTHLIQESNTLYVNDGSANFLDATAESGLAALSLPFTSFGTQWLDFNNSGRLDLFVANGAVKIVEKLVGEPFPYQQPNQLIEHREEGFLVLGKETGVGKLSEVTRGAAFGDIDNEGDVDIVLSNNSGPARLLLNQSASSGNWLRVSLRAKGNVFGIGARVGVVTEDGREAWRTVQSDGSYASASDLRLHFGLGEQAARAVVVKWPSGTTETWELDGVNRVLELHQGTGESSK